MVAAAMAGGLSGVIGAVSTADLGASDVKKKFTPISPHIRGPVDFTSYASPTRTVKEGKRQIDVGDIRTRGELSGEDWGTVFNVNYKKILGSMGKGMTSGDLNKTDKHLYEGFRASHLATAYATQKVEYGPGFSNEQVDIENRRRTKLSSQYQQEAYGHFTEYQAAYNEQANIVERTEMSRRRLRLRERYDTMKIKQSRRSMRQGREARTAGISSLVVNLSGTGLNIGA